MARLVECVPNFSEGRDRGIIDAITKVIESVAGVRLLDVDPGADTNRTVVTFVCPPEVAVEAAFRAMREAASRIDMAKHHGEHPRMGATDVCPFVPLSGVSMEDCVALARELGERVGRELGIPVFLYGEAASRPERRSLADVRAGEYEGMAEKLRDPEWKPDFGPASLPPGPGVSAIGAREFLIAYNVNLNTRDKKLAHEVALDLREAGRNLRDAEGKFVRDAAGEPVKAPGRLKECRSVGWYIEQYGRAQISINLTNFNVTPVHAAFDAAIEEAAKYGLRVTGSELVGLIPLEALRRAGMHYLEKQGRSAGVPDRELVHIAIRSLGLDELGPFDPDQKIIEYRVQDRTNSLVERSVRSFTDELSSESPAPGGGSVAALCGALGAALASMVGNLTIGRKKLEDRWEAMRPVAHRGQELKDWMLQAVDEDTRAFNGVMDAMRLPKKTAEEIAARDRAMLDANRKATLVPLTVLERTREIVDLARTAARSGNPASVSDAGVAALCARAAAEGAYLNVCINLPSVADPTWVDATRQRARELVEDVRREATDVTREVEERI